MSEVESWVLKREADFKGFKGFRNKRKSEP